ncbi:SDR family NAD(P)-dependent oxidoreductase [Plastoroseomonas hellenica]|uniref:SDR family NAD(P)-dependent oxidoreductase n=1 Tax=Plastoroseomonas hellenica TaxID=2687306 RepID=UPI001BA7CA92|nr:SDR family oxidoreductase [Plastoroseomonas hellenica]
MSAAVELPEAPSFRLDGKRALVTGAGRGIGLAAAGALAFAGAEVTLVARSAAEIEAAAAAIRAKGGRAAALALDVTDTAAVTRAVAGQGPFEVLVNNAGTARHAHVLEVTEADYDAVTALNTRAAFFAMQAVARGLRDAGRGGSIINVSSQMGQVGGPRRSVYCATKWAMEGFTKAAALELAPLGIRVNTLCPTFIETPMSRPGLADPATRDWILSNIRLGRVGQPGDLTGAVVFLASDASSLMTGTALIVDGGWTAA